MKRAVLISVALFVLSFGVQGQQPGLRDAYRFTGNQTALELEIKYAAWAESIMSKLNPEQTQKMLNTEFGGMNEVLADLYATPEISAGWRRR